MLKAGGAYVPLDPAFPIERLRYMVEDSGVKALVTRTTLSEALFSGLNLVRVLNDPASSLSGGQKKLLEIGRVLMGRPQLILLDEPVAGVNPSLMREIAAHLRLLVDEGLTLLLIEHHMDTIAELCDHVVVLAEGRNLAEGSFDALLRNDAVQEAYMGRRRRVS